MIINAKGYLYIISYELIIITIMVPHTNKHNYNAYFYNYNNYNNNDHYNIFV